MRWRARFITSRRSPPPPVSAAQDAPPVRVVTFNTACGNPKIRTKQTDFPELPFYQDLIQGRPNAPILSGQEIGPEQAKRLQELSKNGNFTVVHAAAKFNQGNVLLIPKRYQVLDADNHRFVGSHLEGLGKTLLGWVRHGHLPSLSELSGAVEPRMYSEVKLKDRLTGKTFTVLGTHLASSLPQMKLAQAKVLMQAASDAKKDGPVILAGDLNTRTTATDDGKSGWNEAQALDGQIRVLFEKDGFADMGSPGRAGSRTNIDWVLSSGFNADETQLWTGDAMSLPGSPNAETVSDHYAEDDLLSYKQK